MLNTCLLNSLLIQLEPDTANLIPVLTANTCYSYFKIGETASKIVSCHMMSLHSRPRKAMIQAPQPFLKLWQVLNRNTGLKQYRQRCQS